MQVIADIDRAATAAAETLLKYHVSFAPVIPLPILKSLPNVLVLSFAEMASRIGIDRKNIITTLGSDNRDVVTTVTGINGKLRYFVAYNQRLPFYMLQRALARELGHIIMEHDGTKPEEVRQEEALYFARHFLCPRPLIKALQDNINPLTIETVGNVTGCYERCLLGIRRTPGAHTPAELNRKLKEQFSDYINNFLDCQTILTNNDITDIADFGTYMDNYTE